MAEKEESVVKTGEEKEWKKELLKVAMNILEKDDSGVEVITEAIKILFRMKFLKLKKPEGIGIDDTVLAEKFKCPISKEIMADPVVLKSGQTYDRAHIQQWLNEGNQTSPVSEQVLSHSNLTPNNLVRDLISYWLLEKISSSSPSDQKAAAKELRRLTEISSSYPVFSDFPYAISTMVGSLLEHKVDSDPEIQEDMITTVFDISIHNNKNKLLGEGDIMDIKNAAPEILELCSIPKFKEKLIEIGAVKDILDKIKDGVLVDMLLKVLALLSTVENSELGDMDTVRFLHGIIRDNNSSEHAKENCVVILYNVCLDNKDSLLALKGEENEHHTLAKLADIGGSTTIARMARSIITRIRNVFPTTNTA